MNVTALRHEAVFVNPGSYVASPGDCSDTLIWPRSPALIVSSVIGISYSWPVRLSRTVRVSPLALPEVFSSLTGTPSRVSTSAQPIPCSERPVIPLCRFDHQPDTPVLWAVATPAASAVPHGPRRRPGRRGTGQCSSEAAATPPP